MAEPSIPGSGWYLSRKEIEENSPSRRDGIDLKKEAYLRKSYCTFLQDLGMRVKVPQVTIATAIVFCHRFFLRQSHAKNDRRIIATVCMFLAGKVEETPRPLKDVILVSYEIIHKKDPSAVQRIKQKDVYEQQKELILLGERVVLATLGFDFNVHHPYKPLVDAIKKFRVAQNALAQVAWNFVNDGLRTSLCLQFKPHYIAAAAIFLAAKFIKVKLPSDGDKVWWQEFDVTPRQLEDVSNQMLELYEQNREAHSSHPSEVEGSTAGGATHLAKTISAVSENSESVAGQSQYLETVSVERETPVIQIQLRCPLGHSNDNGSADSKSVVCDRDLDCEGKSCSHRDADPSHWSRDEDSLFNGKRETTEGREWKDDASLPDFGDAIIKIDKEKMKAAVVKRRKMQYDISTNGDIMDEDDLIEREIENGVETAAVDEKTKCEKTSWKHDPNVTGSDQAAPGNISSKSLDHGFEETGEEGELSSLEEHDLPSPRFMKRKGGGWPDLERGNMRARYENRG